MYLLIKMCLERSLCPMKYYLVITEYTEVGRESHVTRPCDDVMWNAAIVCTIFNQLKKAAVSIIHRA